jgi:hypothetical protein
MREDARLRLIAVFGALLLLAWDRRGEQLSRARAMYWAGTPLANRP